MPAAMNGSPTGAGIGAAARARASPGLPALERPRAAPASDGRGWRDPHGGRGESSGEEGAPPGTGAASHDSGSGSERQWSVEQGGSPQLEGQAAGDRPPPFAPQHTLKVDAEQWRRYTEGGWARGWGCSGLLVPCALA